MSSYAASYPASWPASWPADSVPVSAAWTPLDLGASLLGWWSADRRDLITLSGSQVTSWKDVVAGYDKTQGVSSARPAWSATSYNGAPGVSFDGIDDYLNMASVPFPVGANPCEIWGLVQNDEVVPGTLSARLYFSYGGSAASGQRRVGELSNLSARVAYLGTGATIVQDNASSFSGRHVARSQIGATQSSLTIDANAPVSASVVPATTTGNTRIGAQATAAPGAFFLGVVRDIIVTGPLNAGQAAQLSTYLMKRRML